MRKIFFISCLTGALLCGVSSVYAQPQAAFSKNKILIGEQVYLTLSIPAADLADGKRVDWPRMKDTINQYIEILDSVIDVKDPKKGFTKKYLVTSFDSGYYAIPPFRFYFDSVAAETNPVLLEVHTVEVDTTKDIRDIKEIREENYATGSGKNAWYKNPWIIGGIAVIVVLAVLFILLRRKRKKEEPVVPEVIVPLHEQLIKDLETLDARQLWQNNQVKLYYVELTDLLRAYVEKRFKVTAMEQTTVQLINNLKTSGIYPEALQVLKSTLELADMVKFAKAVPTGYENQALMDNAKKFALLTKPVEGPEIG